MDILRTTQILINLIQNAIKFSGEGHLITIKLEKVSKDDKNGSYAIKVIDKGIGMSEKDVKRLFTPYY